MSNNENLREGENLTPDKYRGALLEQLAKNPRLVALLIFLMTTLVFSTAQNAQAQTNNKEVSDLVRLPNAKPLKLRGKEYITSGIPHSYLWTQEGKPSEIKLEPKNQEAVEIEFVQNGPNGFSVKITLKKGVKTAQTVSLTAEGKTITTFIVSQPKPNEPLATEKSLEETRSSLAEKLTALESLIKNAATNDQLKEQLKNYVKTADLPSDLKDKLAKIIDNPASKGDLDALKTALLVEIEKDFVKKTDLENAPTKHSLGLFFEQGLTESGIGGYAEYGYNIEEWLALTASLGGGRGIKSVQGFSGEKTEVDMIKGALGIKFDIDLIRDNLKLILGGKFLTEIENAESRALPDGYHVKAGSKTNFGGNVFGGVEAGLKNIGLRAGVSAEFKKGQKEILGDKNWQLQPKIFFGVNGRF